MTEIHGITGKPYKHPEVRRSTPQAFSRPRIDLDGGKRLKRIWKDVNVFSVHAGDIVAGFGRVAEDPVELINIPSVDDGSEEVPGRPTWAVKMVNVLGETRIFPGHERLYAFIEDAFGDRK